MILGKCPYCKTGKIEIRKKNINGKNVLLYACSNAKWQISPDEESFELTEDSECNFRIWQNALSKYGKWFKNKEIKQLLNEKEIEITLYSKKYNKKEYKKYIILNKEYGVSILW